MIVWILSKLLPKQRIYILLYAMCGITLVCNHISNCAVQRLSNSVDVLESIPEQDRGTLLEIPVGKMPHKKRVGVNWDPSDDDFRPYASIKPLPPGHLYTLRQALSCVASQLDPLGMISPIIITGGILIQDIHRFLNENQN